MHSVGIEPTSRVRGGLHNCKGATYIRERGKVLNPHRSGHFLGAEVDILRRSESPPIGTIKELSKGGLDHCLFLKLPAKCVSVIMLTLEKNQGCAMLTVFNWSRV